MPAAIIGQVALLMCVIIGLLMWADSMAIGIGVGAALAAAIARWAWERWVRSQ